MHPLLFWSLFLWWAFYLSKAYQDYLYVASSLVLMYSMRPRLQQSKSLIWLSAWAFLFRILHSFFQRRRSWFWQAFWVVIVIQSRIKMRPNTSLERFMEWTALLFGLRLAVVPVEIFYSVVEDKSQAFPFSIISPWWRLSKPLWQPAAKKHWLKHTDGLCPACQSFTRASNLIMGSKLPLTRLVEWHQPWPSLRALRASAEHPSHSCHLCKLMWYSISKTRRHEILTSLAIAVEQGRPPLEMSKYSQRCSNP